MSKLNRLQACNMVRSEGLITSIQGDQILSNTIIHKFLVGLFLQKKHGVQIICATFKSMHANQTWTIHITYKQALNFLRKYYPRVK